MDRKLIDRYFNDQCSKKELEQVLDWFQTAEGRRFLEKDIKGQNHKFLENGGCFQISRLKASTSSDVFNFVKAIKERGENNFLHCIQLTTNGL